MSTQLEDPADSSIADLFHQLLEDSGDFVRAEINLYREIGLHRARKAKNGVIALALAAVLFLSGLIVLLVMLAQGLAIHIGPVGAGLVVAGVVFAAGVVLARYGIARMGALSGDMEERTALRNGERKA